VTVGLPLPRAIPRHWYVSRQMTNFRDMTLQIVGVPAGHRLLTA
jgi:hypothetical protein